MQQFADQCRTHSSSEIRTAWEKLCHAAVVLLLLKLDQGFGLTSRFDEAHASDVSHEFVRSHDVFKYLCDKHGITPPPLSPKAFADWLLKY